jgi:hypothetical protein
MVTRDEVDRRTRVANTAGACGRRTAERPHLLSAGEKLLEARSQFTHEAEFKNWVRHNFPGQIRLAHRSLQMAIEHNAQASRELEAARVAGYTA